MKLFVECLRRTKLDFKGRVAWSFLTRQMYRKCNAEPTDSQNYIAQIKIIKGVKIALLFRETIGNPLLIKVSIRTNAAIDADRLVRPLGGGGHSLAAGVTLQPPIKRAYQKITQHIKNCQFFS